MKPGRLLVLVALLGAFVIVLVLVFGSSGGHSTARIQALPAGTPADVAARAGCTEVRTVQMQIQADGRATVVQDHAKAAVSDLAVAVAHDVSWRSLQSGVQLLAQSLESDDAEQAQLGIAIARYQCGRVGIVLQGAVTSHPTP